MTENKRYMLNLEADNCEDSEITCFICWEKNCDLATYVRPTYPSGKWTGRTELLGLHQRCAESSCHRLRNNNISDIYGIAREQIIKALEEEVQDAFKNAQAIEKYSVDESRVRNMVASTLKELLIAFKERTC